jgi:transketolase
MRKKFVEIIHVEMSSNEDIVVLTADLGYGLWDRIKIDYPNRFFDMGSSEQLMIGTACGMSLEGKIPVCYSITPFLLYRPFEWIRNYLNTEKINVKLAGGGRDKDYGYLGSTHWATEDVDILGCLKNIDIYKTDPINDLEFKILVNSFLYSKSPAYINLKK